MDKFEEAGIPTRFVQDNPPDRAGSFAWAALSDSTAPGEARQGDRGRSV